MFKRQQTGSVVCPSCGRLVGIHDKECFNCGRKNPGMWGFAPILRRLGQDLGFVQVIIWGCSLLYLATLLFDPAGIQMGGPFTFLSPSITSLNRFGATGSIPVLAGGRWWTLLSAGWLHGSLLHILFNMFWVYQLAPITVQIYGAGRAFIIYTVASVSGFFLSTLMGSPLTLGASAAIFGILASLIYAGRRGVATEISRQAAIYAVVLFLFGLFVRGIDNWAHLGGLLGLRAPRIPRQGGIDNWAHLGGLLGGYGISMLFNPLKPEKSDHLMLALGCLALTILSVVASIL